jgi:hypothetical protein
MDIATIQWDSVTLEYLNNAHQTVDFYSFSRAGKVIYIGKSYLQHVEDEVKQSIRRLSVNTIGLAIHVGYLDLSKSSASKRSVKLINDVESLLILCNQPNLNTLSKSGYWGRDDLKVKSIGHPNLNPCVKVENEEINCKCR